MYRALQQHWPNYLIEAWALGLFMVSATFCCGMLELPGSPGRSWVADPGLRRWLMGLAMGATAVLLIYSKWGRRSGAHMNPAVTLAFWALGKIAPEDAGWYILAQCVGGVVAMCLLKTLFPDFLEAPEVNFVQTLPGKGGIGAAFLCEMLMAFGLLLMVLYSSNDERSAPYTGVFAGCLVMLYITFEAPVSGMSINPARTLASAVAAGYFSHFWIYAFAPVLGMLGAARVWKLWICTRSEFECAWVKAEKTVQIPEM